MLEAEIKKLCEALADGQGQFSKADLEIAVEWVENTRIGSDLVELVMQSRIGLKVNEAGELVFTPRRGQNG